jgi:hypothetical protein
MKVKTNLIGGVFFILLGVILFLLMPSQIIVSGSVPFLESAKAAPFLSILIMFVCGLILVFQSVVLKKEKEVVIDFAEQKYALYLILFLIGYSVLIYLIGFLIASLLLVLALSKFFKLESKIQVLIVMGICGLVYFIFLYIFHISLPGIGGAILS